VGQQKRHKAINFDLDTENLINIFGETKRSEAYRDVQKFFVAHGFEHRQWSGYRSLHPMSYFEISELLTVMAKQHYWLEKCINKFDVTNVGVESDMRHIFQEVAYELSNDEDDIVFQ
jgi:cell filamentation protein